MRVTRVAAVLCGLALVASAPGAAKPGVSSIPLPTGWQPEGIDIAGHQAYVGSIPTGAVWRGDVRTGVGSVLVPAQPGRNAIGVDVDHRGRLWVAGGATGQAYVYDAATGASRASLQLASGAPTFINDVVVTKRAAWFTDSQKAVLYRVALHGSADPTQADVTTVPLGGDFVLQPGFNLNGIDASADGKTLIVVQSNAGALFRVPARTGIADRIELTGGDAAFGDGLLLRDRKLYVVQNQLNRIAVVKLDRRLASGTVVRYLTDPSFAVPTTIARHGKQIVAVNARFGAPDPANAAYSLTVLRLKQH